MPETPEPALTSEEWAAIARREPVKRPNGYELYVDGPWGVVVSNTGVAVPGIHEDRHALAALCLYGQPFGFTREDVEGLTWRAEQAHHSGERVFLESLRDRIAALLPPGEAPE